MLKEKALYYYQNGYNCSQCLIKACEVVYNIPISKQSLKMCSAINMGFGIGSICSVLIAGIMIFGVMFDEYTAKKLRLKFLSDFQENHSLNCMNLKKEMNINEGCEKIITEVAERVEKLINSEISNK